MTKLPSRKFTFRVTGMAARLQYICRVLYGGHIRKFSRAIGVPRKKTCLLFLGRVSPTPLMLADIVTRTAVRAEWLLCGIGPMLLQPELDDNLPLALPSQLSCSFPVFNSLALSAVIKGLYMPKSAIPAEPAKPQATPEHLAVATAMYKVREKNQPVLFFFGPAAFVAGVGPITGAMMRSGYVSSVATTGAGVAQDTRSTHQPGSLNTVAQFAAQQGVGYGEAVGRWASSGKQPSPCKHISLVHTAYLLGAPATIHVEFGEIAQHLYPAARGAELGAAIGAATYADLLIFTAQVEQMVLGGGGVILFSGDCADRGLKLFINALVAIQARKTKVPLLTVVIVGPYCCEQHIIDTLHYRGARLLSLPDAYRGTLYHLSKACDAVFNGVNLNANTADSKTCSAH